MVKQFRLEDEFGDMRQEKSFTRDELIDKYAADIQFWKKREPAIDVNRKPNMRTICAHAIATNAQSAMWRLCSEKGIHAEVEAKIVITYFFGDGDRRLDDARTFGQTCFRCSARDYDLQTNMRNFLCKHNRTFS